MMAGIFARNPLDKRLLGRYTVQVQQSKACSGIAFTRRFSQTGSQQFGLCSGICAPLCAYVGMTTVNTISGSAAVLFYLFLPKLGGAFAISSMEHQINEDIRDKEVRLIADDGEQLGIVSAQKALEIAIEKGMDLVKIAPQAQPPVCRIMDYGKFRFEQAKREKEARKNQRVVEIKEIRLTPGIDVNDLNVKVGHARRFLKGGDKVKVSVRFRGREVTHSSIGLELLQRFAEQCTEFGVIEKQPKLEGRHMHMFLAPKKEK